VDNDEDPFAEPKPVAEAKAPAAGDAPADVKPDAKPEAEADVSALVAALPPAEVKPPGDPNTPVAADAPKAGGADKPAEAPKAEAPSFPIDASGQLVSGETFNGAAELADILAHSKRDFFARCLTEKMLTYALGRGTEYYDRAAIEKITADLAKNQYKFSSLILGVVHSLPFQMRRGEGEHQPALAAAETK
jgi:hypothetical protein